MTYQENFDCDMLVIGSGASGMSAAVTAAAPHKAEPTHPEPSVEEDGVLVIGEIA